MAQHDSRQPAASRTAFSMSDGFPAVYRRFCRFIWRRSTRKASTNQSLGGFAVSTRRLKTAKSADASNRDSTEIHPAPARVPDFYAEKPRESAA
jgi:hypothetical protein